MSGTTGSSNAWLKAAITELGAREQALAAQTTPQAVNMPTKRTKVVPKPPRGNNNSNNILARMVFGDQDQRRDRNVTDPDDQRKIAAAQAAIAEQRRLGTAAKVEIPGPGGRALNGNFFSAAGHNLAEEQAPDLSRPVVLFLSGSAGSAERYGTDIAEHYQSSGASMLAVNYGGYGKPDGDENNDDGVDPSEQSLLEDGQAMLQHLLDLGYEPDQIIMHGFSMGGAVAGMLQAHNEKNGLDLRGTMLDRPMVSIGGATQSHALDMFGTNEAVGAIMTPAAKLVSAVTRKVCGSMSARKAVLANGESRSRIVVSGDQGRFGRTGANLRTKLQGKQPDRPVTGADSGSNHEDHAAMLDANQGAMQELIDRSANSSGSKAVRFDDGLSDAEKTSTRKLREQVARELASIETKVTTLRTSVTTLENAANAPIPQGGNAAPVVTFMKRKKSEALEQLSALNDFTRLSANLAVETRDSISSNVNTIRGLLERVAAVAAKLGEAPDYDPAQIEAELAILQQTAGKLANPPARMNRLLELTLLKGAYDRLIRMQSDGVDLDDDQAALDQAKQLLDAAKPKQTPPKLPTPPPLDRSGSRIGLARQRSRADLEESLS